MPKYLTFNTSSELLRIPTDSLVFVRADGNYSDIVVADQHAYTLTMQLGEIENVIQKADVDGTSSFMRIGRSLIVNVDFITHVNLSKQRIVLSDCRNFYYELSASKESLRKLKEVLNVIHL